MRAVQSIVFTAFLVFALAPTVAQESKEFTNYHLAFESTLGEESETMAVTASEAQGPFKLFSREPDLQISGGLTTLESEQIKLNYEVSHNVGQAGYSLSGSIILEPGERIEVTKGSGRKLVIELSRLD